MPCRVDNIGNRIVVAGVFELSHLWRLSGAIHNLTRNLGYEDLVLDFSTCSRAAAAPMLGLCAEASALRARKIDIELIAPSDQDTRRTFTNANWAHEIDPARFRKSTYRGYRNLPAARFDSHNDQAQVVNRMVESILSSIPGMEREDLAAIEWSVNEITDNVLVHAQSEGGGLAQITNYPAKRRVEFSVADGGVGIPRTLRPRFPGLADYELLEQATKEGVTRDPSLGQGNGLYGSFSVASTSNGSFHILSGYGMLSYQAQELRMTNERVPYPGTLVVATMDCSSPSALADALRFGDVQYRPLGYIDTRYEDRGDGELSFRMSDETLSCGSRVAGTPVRNRLANLVRMNPGRRILVDMENVPLVSSSFADEVFGKLFKALGPLGFTSSLELRNVSANARALIDKAISQRMRSPDSFDE